MLFSIIESLHVARALQESNAHSHIVHAGTLFDVLAGMDSSSIVDDSGIRKSISDKRRYRYKRLDNGVKTVLVEDPEAVFASACADVASGYLDDPDDLPGLAHYVEHALHLGSNKFPDEKEYKRFLAENGGRSNAMTFNIHTCYHFRVHNEALDGALDRLSRFFIDPLFLTDSMEREVVNLHSEYSRNLNSDAVKMLHLRRSIRPYPLNKFSTGNLETLRDKPKECGVDIAGRCRDWWSGRYLASNIALCVVGPQDLDDLESHVESYFSDIPVTRNESSNVQQCTEFQMPDNPENRGKWFEIAPLREKRTLDLEWWMPYSKMKDMKSKPWHWVGHLVGHEGKGSASLLLKRRGFIQELRTHVGEEVRRGQGCMTWHCTVEISEFGLNHIPEIIGIIYSSIQLASCMTEVERKSLFEELRTVTQVQFDYKSRESPVEYAKDLARRLQYHPPEDALIVPVLMEDFSNSAISEFISYITPSNMNVYFASKKFEGSTTDQETWYQAKFTETTMPQAVQEAIEAVQSGTILPYQLTMPEPNWAIPTNTELRQNEDGAVHWTKPPVQIMDSQAGRCWYRKDVSFDVPKASVHVHLFSPFVHSCALHAVTARVFCAVVNDALLPDVYPATIAGTSYSLSPNATGLVLQFYGFTEIIPKIVSVVLRTMTNLSQEELKERYTVQLGKLIQGFKHHQFLNPHDQAHYCAKHLLTSPHWHVQELLKSCSSLSPAHVLEFWQDFCREVYLESLVYGNIDAHEAKGLHENLLQDLRPSGLGGESWPLQRVHRIGPVKDSIDKRENGCTLDIHAEPCCITYVPDNPNPRNSNSGIYIVFQIGLDECETLAWVSVFKQIAEKPAFHQLRTVEGLGYAVRLEHFRIHNVVALGLRLLTTQATPRKLEERATAWMDKFGTYLEEMSESDFDKYKASVIQQYLEPPKTLAAASHKWWAKITNRRYRFSLPQDIANQIEAIQKPDLIRLYNLHFRTASPMERRMCVEIWAGGLDVNVLDDHVVIGGDEVDVKQVWEMYPGGSISVG